MRAQSPEASDDELSQSAERTLENVRGLFALFAAAIIGILIGSYIIVIVAIITLIVVALRAVPRWGVIAVRVVGALLIVALLALWDGMTIVSRIPGTESGPAIWVLAAGTLLNSILVFSRTGSHVWRSHT